MFKSWQPTVKPPFLIGLVIAIFSSPAFAEDTELPYCQRTEAPCQTADVTLANGSKVCGLQSDDQTIDIFRGIPFADAERWQDPTPTKPWKGTFPAVDFGPICPQVNPTQGNDCESGACLLAQAEDCLSLNIWTPGTDDLKRPVLVYIYGGGFIEGASSTNLFDGSALARAGDAVIVSFNYRLGALGFMVTPQYQGETLTGWKGNFGFLDQREAMKWVQRNIAAFGGDPARVTIFGESAGAMSVGLHSVASPGSRGLFQAAIMESNPLGIPYKNVDEAKPFFRDLARELGCRSLLETDKERIDCMNREIVLSAKTRIHTKPWPAILKAQSKVKPTKTQLGLGHLKEFLVWTPVLDGTNIIYEPMEAIANHKPTDLPMIIGTNRNEGLIFGEGVMAGEVALWEKKHSKICQLTDPSCGFTDSAYETLLKAVFPQQFPDAYKKVVNNSRYQPAGNSEANGAQLSNLATDYLFTCANHFFIKTANRPVYAYQFNQPPSAPFYENLWPVGSACRGGMATCHGAELPYVFDSFVQNWCPAGGVPPETQTLASTMGGYWLKFASSPGSGPGTAWNAYFSDADYIRFANTITHGAPLQGHQETPVDCTFWDKLHPEENWKSYDLFAPPGH